MPRQEDRPELARHPFCAGFVSNVNAITLVIISWITFTKTSGLSPLAAGQWKVRPGSADLFWPPPP